MERPTYALSEPLPFGLLLESDPPPFPVSVGISSARARVHRRTALSAPHGPAHGKQAAWHEHAPTLPCNPSRCDTPVRARAGQGGGVSIAFPFSKVDRHMVPAPPPSPLVSSFSPHRAGPSPISCSARSAASSSTAPASPRPSSRHAPSSSVPRISSSPQAPCAPTMAVGPSPRVFHLATPTAGGSSASPRSPAYPGGSLLNL